MILIQYHNVCIRTLFLWCNKHVLWPRSTWSNLTHMFITGWSMFQKCHLCIFLNQFGVTPILDSPTKDKEISFFFFKFHGSLAFFRMVASWPCWLEDGSHRGTVVCTVPFWRSMGLPLKTCHFLYFCSLSPDTHEMQWSLQFVLMFLFCFPSAKTVKQKKRDELNSSHSGQTKQGKIARAFSDTVK